MMKACGDVRRTGKRRKRHGGQDACKRPGGYFSGPFTCTRAVGRLDVELQTVALWLFLNSLQLPIYEQMPRGPSLPASCPRLPDFRGTVIGLGSPTQKKGWGCTCRASGLPPEGGSPFFTAIRCRLFCPRWLPVVFCRTCRGAGGAGRAQRVCVDAGCPSHRRPSPTP